MLFRSLLSYVTAKSGVHFHHLFITDLDGCVILRKSSGASHSAQNSGSFLVRNQMSPSIWQNYCPKYLRTALLYPACRTICKRIHLFKNCRLLSSALIFCKLLLTLMIAKKIFIHHPNPVRHPRTHQHTDFKDFFMKT